MAQQVPNLLLFSLSGITDHLCFWGVPDKVSDKKALYIPLIRILLWVMFSWLVECVYSRDYIGVVIILSVLKV